MHARHSLDFSGRHSLDFSGRHSLDYSGRGIDRSVRPVLAEDEALPAYRPDGGRVWLLMVHECICHQC